MTTSSNFRQIPSVARRESKRKQQVILDANRGKKTANMMEEETN